MADIQNNARLTQKLAQAADRLQIGEHKRLALQDLPSGSYSWSVPEHAQLSLLLGIFTPTDITVTVELTGPHARAEIYGLVATSADKTSITINQHHQAPETDSSALFKGVFGDAAQAVLQGLVTINQQAYKARASQYHKALLLDPRASCKAVPSFAVHNHQVRCNHGAAVGKLAIEHLTYLQSRGISQAAARQLLSAGFAQEIIEQLKADEQSWKQRVAEVVQLTK